MKDKLLQLLCLVISLPILWTMDADLISSIAISIAFILGCSLIGAALDTIRTFLAKTFGSWLLYSTCIGVMIHELSHALLAILTGAKVISVTLFQVESDKKTLGEVSFITRGNCIFRGIQASFASAAPMFIGTVLLLVSFTYIKPLLASWQLVIFWYVAISIFLHMSLSNQDVKNIFSNIFSLLFVLIILISAVLLVNEEYEFSTEIFKLQSMIHDKFDVLKHVKVTVDN